MKVCYNSESIFLLMGEMFLAPETGEDAGNAAFILDMTEQGQIEDFVPGDGTDGNATFV